MRIGVFDSGVGGLTVLRNIIDKYPNNEYIYFGDTLNMPYGSKEKSLLLKLSSRIVEFFISQNVDIVIIACGTVSSNSYLDLKNNYNVPIYDILTPVLKYLNSCKLSNLAVIATEMTIKSGIFNSIKGIQEIACSKFVPLIEKNMIESEEMIEAIKEYLSVKEFDNLIFGCTHYPLIKNKIEKVLNKKINFIDMGKILADNIKIEESSYKLNLYFSKLDKNTIDIVDRMFTNYKIAEKEL